MTFKLELDDLIARVEDKDDIKVLSRETFNELALDDECTIADVKRVEHRLATYRAKAVQALAHVALDELVANEKKEYVDTRADYGTQSEIRNRVRRSHTVGKGDKMKTFHGHSTVVVSNGHEPELLEAIENIGKRGVDLFGKK